MHTAHTTLAEYEATAPIAANDNGNNAGDILYWLGLLLTVGLDRLSVGHVDDQITRRQTPVGRQRNSVQRLQPLTVLSRTTNVWFYCESASRVAYDEPVTLCWTMLTCWHLPMFLFPALMHNMIA